MNNLIYEKINKAVEKEKENIIEFIQKLIRIPTVNPWFQSGSQFEKIEDAQIYLANQLKELGANTYLWEPDSNFVKDKTGLERDYSNRPNLLAEFPSREDDPYLLLLGHIDVVDPGGNWQFEPFSGHINNGNIYGRGACDMKAGLTSMIMALKIIQKLDLKLQKKVIFGSVVDEEAGGTGTIDFINKIKKPKYGVLGEPTDLKIAPLCRGILWGKIKVVGRSGHIEIDHPNWEKGGAVDSIKKARFILDFLDKLNRKWAKIKTHTLLPIPCQVITAQINGGSHPTTFAGETEIVFNAQYLPEEKSKNNDGQIIKEEIEQYLRKITEHDSWLEKNPPQIEWLIDAGCGEISPEEEIVQKFSQCSNEFSESVKIEGVTTHTDMDILIDNGIKAITFGAGDPKFAHQNNEKIDINDLLTAIKIYAGSIISLCGIRE